MHAKPVYNQLQAGANWCGPKPVEDQLKTGQNQSKPVHPGPVSVHDHSKMQATSLGCRLPICGTKDQTRPDLKTLVV
jgi:hypothetical protein